MHRLRRPWDRLLSVLRRLSVRDAQRNGLRLLLEMSNAGMDRRAGEDAMTFRIGPDLIEVYEDEPSGPYCQHCGQELDYEECDQCEDGFSDHDCGEDTCCCLDPEPNVRCEQCGGKGFWFFCTNPACPSK